MIGPDPPDTAKAATSAYQRYTLLMFEAAGGRAKSAAAQAQWAGNLAKRAKLSQVAGPAGTVANLLNLAGYGYGIWKCWNR
jgi:hypothetical protein